MKNLVKFSAPLALALAMCLSVAQVTPPRTNQKTDPIPKQKSSDPIEDIRRVINGQDLPKSLSEGFDPIGPVYARAESLVSFRASARLKGSTIIYALQGGPPDATIDPNTGDFFWTPSVAGTFTFELIAASREDSNRILKQKVTVVVSKPLAPYGYEFFLAPRSMIEARMEAFRMGQGKPLLPVSSQSTDGELIPTGGTKAKSETDEKTGTNGQTGNGTSNGNGNGNGHGHGTEAGLEQKKSEVVQQFDQANNANLLLNQLKYQNPNTSEAVRYLVGPFDMMTSNVFVPAPERYQLGAGDQLTIRFWSPTMAAEEVSIKIDGQGSVALPVSGRKLTLRGQTLAQAETMILKALGEQVRDVQVSVSLKELRTMPVTVLGEAFLPGSYQVPSVATLFNLLYIVGGPTENGSLRRIELRRNDGSRKSFDLYRFLVFGDSSQDVPLQPGDTIFIPTVESRVTVDGEVGRAAIYETIPNETLKDVLKLAGGVKATGVSQRVSLSTVDPGVGRKLLDIDLKENLNPFVFGGDKVQVLSVRPVLTNIVVLEGAVDQPGQYALSEGMTVSTLLERARGLLPETYRVRADLVRQNDDQTSLLVPIDLNKAIQKDPAHDVVLKVNDRLKVYRTDEAMWLGDRRVIVSGPVRRPGSYERQDGMRVIDLLLQAGGLLGEAFLEQGFIQRFNPDGTAGDLIKVDFRRAATGDETQNVVLLDRDVLTIFRTEEAKFIPDQQVKILGAVQRPGQYPGSANLSLSDLIDLAGGVLPSASGIVEVSKSRVLEGAAPARYSLTDVLSGAIQVKLEPGDLVSLPTNGSFVDSPRTVYVSGAVNQPGWYSINSTTDSISDIIGRAGGLQEDAFPRGVQFYRDPKKLATLAQERLSPRVKEVLSIIAEDEYLRAKAKSEVDKARVLRSVNTSQPLALPGVGAISSTTTGPAITFDSNTVSPARKLGLGDLVPSGNLNVQLEGALKQPKGKHDIRLEEGDIIIVPTKPSTVTVVGAVTVPQALLYESGKNLLYYVDRSGGMMSDAAEKFILVIRANGEVVRADRRTRIDLGDLIFVPTKVMAEKLSDRQAEIDAISRNVTSAGVMFAIIKSLLGR